jgi:hypothetical protein
MKLCLSVVASILAVASTAVPGFAQIVPKVSTFYSTTWVTQVSSGSRGTPFFPDFQDQLDAIAAASGASDLFKMDSWEEQSISFDTAEGAFAKRQIRVLVVERFGKPKRRIEVHFQDNKTVQICEFEFDGELSRALPRTVVACEMALFKKKSIQVGQVFEVKGTLLSGVVAWNILGKEGKPLLSLKWLQIGRASPDWSWVGTEMVGAIELVQAQSASVDDQPLIRQIDVLEPQILQMMRSKYPGVSAEKQSAIDVAQQSLLRGPLTTSAVLFLIAGLFVTFSVAVLYVLSRRRPKPKFEFRDDYKD